MTGTDVFRHSTPDLYDRLMVPLLFEPYARLLVERVARLGPNRILETAAGTGVVTRAIAAALPQADIVATDINPGMLAVAARQVQSERVTFEAANAQDLPHPDASFDLVLCQFGVMFFPDKVQAGREARRVLRPGGHYLLVSFDQLELNPVPHAADEAVAALFPEDPPRYMERGPFSYSNPRLIEGDLRAAGFSTVEVDTVGLSSPVRARDAAEGMVLGSPFRAEIERRDPDSLERATDAVEAALREWDGRNAPMSAHIATATA
jgi:ubiquinone/menaquinone biosynthesis C-methylase UbiE